MRLQNKVALLSGVGPGMGRATALLFAQEGASVVLAARRQEYVGEAVSQIESMGGRAVALPGDLSKKSEVERIVQGALDHFGRLDILYSGVGGSFEPTRDFSDVSESFWQQALTNTLSSAYNLAHTVRPVMKGQGGGAIVTIAASYSVRQEGNPAYGAAKAGIIGLSQNLAREFYPDNIRVNTVASGLIRGRSAEKTVAAAPRSLGRAGYPEDIAHAALYLASDEASWVTGQVLAVEGGVDVGARPLWQFER